MDSTGALELADVPESLLVVGGGYIGLEMATVYAALGTRVTVVELTDGCCRRRSRSGPSAAQETDRGIRGDSAGREGRRHGRKGPGDRSQLRRQCRSQGPAVQPRAGFRRPPAEQRRPGPGEDQGPGRQARLRQRGCPAADGRSDIWAIGDVAGQPMLADKASHEGKAAVEAIAGRKVAFEPRHSGRGFHRSGNRLGRPDGNRGQGTRPDRRSGSISLGRQRTGPIRWPHRRPDEVAHRSRQPTRLRLRHRRRRRRRTDCRGRAGHRDGGFRGRRSPSRFIPIPRSAKRWVLPPRSSSALPPICTARERGKTDLRIGESIAGA